MNIRQQEYKKNRLLGMSPENAAIAAKYSPKTARAKAYRIERSAKVGMADAFEQAGLTNKKIVEFALEGLKASKVISCNVIAPDGEGMKDANSMTKDFVDVPDWQARHKFFETTLKLTDRIKDRVEHSGEIKSGETRIILIHPKERISGDKPQSVSV